MPLHIDRVDAEMNVTDAQPGTAQAVGPLTGGREELRERLRPIVLDILEEELRRIAREQG